MSLSYPEPIKPYETKTFRINKLSAAKSDIITVEGHSMYTDLRGTLTISGPDGLPVTILAKGYWTHAEVADAA